MENLILPVVAFLIAILLNSLYFSKTRVDNIETKIFTVQLMINLFESFIMSMVILSAYTIFKNQINGIIILLNRIDYILLLFWMWCLFIYVAWVTIKNVEHKKRITQISLLINIVLSILTLLLPLHGINEGGNMNSYGLATDILYISIVAYLVFIFAIIFSNIKNFSSKKYYPIYLFLALICIALLIRELNPTFIFISFLISFINLLMFFTIENPDVKILGEISLAKDQAEKANMAKTDFLSSMSHEIRTPLNAIKGYSELTVETLDIKEANENAKEIVKAVDVLLEIINGVLDISRIESGNMEIVNSDYNPVELFNDTCRMINIKMKEKELDFRINIAKDIPTTLYGDKGNIQKVLLNLLSNAAKYTTEGYVDLNIQCINKNNICSLIIAVEDSGRGIKPDKIEKLFKKFERLDEDKNTTTEGTGLGLAITKQLIELMGGKIAVQSKYGEGSKFTASLAQEIKNPAPNSLSVFDIDSKEIAINKDEVADVVDSTFKGKPDFSLKTVLIVDDNKTNINIAKKLLKNYNFEIVDCLTGQDVLDKINNGEKFDLLLVDDMMPGMSGTEMMTTLKSHGYEVPMVVLTANAMSGEKEKYLSIGFDDYLGKPISRDELDRVINEYLHDEKKGQALGIKEESKSIFEPLPDTIHKVENKVDNTKPTRGIEYLKANEIDVDSGVELLGSIETYNETLQEFLNSINDKLLLIEEYKVKKDMQNYGIQVHSLKSDSKYLGFVGLAEKAYNHEKASKDGNINYVINDYDMLIIELVRVLDVVKKYLNK